MGHTCVVSFKKQRADPLQAQSTCAVCRSLLYSSFEAEWGYTLKTGSAKKKIILMVSLISHMQVATLSRQF